MPLCRPWSGVRSRRLVLAAAILAFAGGNSPIEGDDTPVSSSGAQVEVNGGQERQKKIRRREVQIDLGDSKDTSVDAHPRKKNVVEINLGDSKDATVEIVRERGQANVEINGYRVKSR